MLTITSFNRRPLRFTTIEFLSWLIFSITALSINPSLCGAYTMRAVESSFIASIFSISLSKLFQCTRNNEYFSADFRLLFRIFTTFDFWNNPESTSIFCKPSYSVSANTAIFLFESPIPSLYQTGKIPLANRYIPYKTAIKVTSVDMPPSTMKTG